MDEFDRSFGGINTSAAVAGPAEPAGVRRRVMACAQDHSRQPRADAPPAGADAAGVGLAAAVPGHAGGDQLPRSDDDAEGPARAGLAADHAAAARAHAQPARRLDLPQRRVPAAAPVRAADRRPDAAVSPGGPAQRAVDAGGAGRPAVAPASRRGRAAQPAAAHGASAGRGRLRRHRRGRGGQPGGQHHAGGHADRCHADQCLPRPVPAGRRQRGAQLGGLRVPARGREADEPRPTTPAACCRWCRGCSTSA